MNNHSPKEETPKDLGFGTASQEKGVRLLNQDGTFNIERRGLTKEWSTNMYHTLITMSWSRFNLLVLCIYLVANLLFASLYLIAGTDSLEGAKGINMMGKFWDAFFFSAQTITTVGYGKISPQGFYPNIIASVESMIGLLGFALATGLLYGRFSRPVSKILYSHNALIAPFHDGRGFMFRLANARKNQLIEAEMQVVFSLNKTVNGKSGRTFHTLKLEREKINFIWSSWTIVHPINEESPFYGLSLEDLINAEAEITILLKAFDDSFSQTVYSRSSYKAEEFVWGAKFSNIHGRTKDGNYADLHRIGEFEKAELPPLG
jgi:inward rectifier potassium channel